MRTTTKTFLFSAGLLLGAAVMSNPVAAATPVKNIVLVHGAW